MAQVMHGSPGGQVEMRDGVAGLAGEFHAAHGDEADGEAVHAVADVGARAVGVPQVRNTALLSSRLESRLTPDSFAVCCNG